GRLPVLSQFAARRGLSGAILSPFAYWRGLASLIGLRAPEIPGATGRIETDYEGKAREAIAVLGTQDFVVIHVGGPGAASARGDAEEKVDALERIDARLLTPLLAGVKKLDDFRLMVVPDVAFPVEERTLVRDPVPFLLYASHGITRRVRAEFAESAVAEAPLRVDEGYRLIELLLKEEGA
ncbi:MAG TPA: phosphoglycerate mutase, partial [Armatimonadota bacterium]|nr:phosphoglycerate mutase [Armatimonadota bacterium]